MERSRVTELHYITPIVNLPSIVERGILSHRRAKAVARMSIADEDVQDRRRGKRVPNGRMLHEYANVYFDARNPMMFKRQGRRRELAVVRVDPDILDIPDTVVADGNAASGLTRFAPSPEGLRMLDKRSVYAEYWTDIDELIQAEKKRQRCAEVLVPHVIPPEYLTGCYVCANGLLQPCRDAAPELEVVVSARVFFR